MRLLTGLMVCLLVGACGGEQPSVEALVAQLSIREMDAATGTPIAEAAAAKLGELGDRTAVPALVEVLRTHPFSMTRAAAMQSLGLLQAVDAVPVVIDAMLDMYGALYRTDFAVVQITDNDLRLPRPASRAMIVAHQRALRDWYRKYESKLREHRGQPGPSQVTLGEAPPPHDSSASRKQVAGPYVGRRWSDTVLVYLRADGSFVLRGTSRSSGTCQRK